MHYWSLQWPLALEIAAGLVAASVAMRLARRWNTLPYLCREIAIVLALYALWQLGGAQALSQVAGAREHALAIWHAERWLHLPSEVSLQRLFLPHPLLVRALDDYYAGMHLSSMFALLVWVMWRHRAQYAFVRAVVVTVTASCLLVQLVPVAPPRMFPGLGFVDTALRYGQSVYGSMGSGAPTQLAAMPSVHVAWSVLVAATVVALARSRWRFVAVAHPVLTVLVVTVTANHWWFDQLAAVVLLALSYALCCAVRSAWSTRGALATQRTQATA